MAKELISYLEMCRREGAGLRRGMHFRLRGDYSVLLMSVQPRAPYQDRFTDGTTLIYEGHDEPQSAAVPHPKAVDQPLCTAYGTPTQNAKFYQAAQAYRHGQQPPERVKVYEKCRPGLWLYRGLFHLVDSWQEADRSRRVFKFKLLAALGEADDSPLPTFPPRPRRSIPRAVKLAVWQRDGGRCVVCGTRKRLHFDHVVPYSKGGTSVVTENIQLLCARHNLAKGARLSVAEDTAPRAPVPY
jgi:HNH endonuclease